MPVVVMYMPSALPCSTTLVSPPAMRTPAFARRLAMARTSASQDIGGQSGFENEGDDQGFGSGAGDGEIVHRAVDGEFADGAAGKTQRLDDKTVGGHSDAGAVDLNVRSVGQAVRGGTVKKRREQAFDSRRLALPPAPWAISICGSRNWIFGRSDQRAARSSGLNLDSTGSR